MATDRMKLASIVALTLLIHVLAGWTWSVAGGVIAGWLWSAGGWWRGAIVVGGAWLALVAYSILIATGPSLRLHAILSGIAGGIPSWMIPVLIVMVGATLGVAGGLVGSSARTLSRRRSTAADTDNI